MEPWQWGYSWMLLEEMRFPEAGWRAGLGTSVGQEGSRGNPKERPGDDLEVLVDNIKETSQGFSGDWSELAANLHVNGSFGPKCKPGGRDNVSRMGVVVVVVFVGFWSSLFQKRSLLFLQSCVVAVYCPEQPRELVCACVEGAGANPLSGSGCCVLPWPLALLTVHVCEATLRAPNCSPSCCASQLPVHTLPGPWLCRLPGWATCGTSVG